MGTNTVQICANCVASQDFQEIHVHGVLFPCFLSTNRCEFSPHVLVQPLVCTGGGFRSQMIPTFFGSITEPSTIRADQSDRPRLCHIASEIAAQRARALQAPRTGSRFRGLPGGFRMNSWIFRYLVRIYYNYVGLAHPSTWQFVWRFTRIGIRRGN